MTHIKIRIEPSMLKIYKIDKFLFIFV